MSYGKVRNSLRVPALVLTIASIITKMAYNFFRFLTNLKAGDDFLDALFSLDIDAGKIVDFFFGEAVSTVIFITMIIFLVYTIGACNKRFAKGGLGVGVLLYGFVNVLWFCEMCVGSAMHDYPLAVSDVLGYAWDITFCTIFMIWLFARSKNRVLPATCLGMAGISFVRYLVIRGENIVYTLENMVDYGGSLFDWSYLANSISWTCFEAVVVIVIAAELTRKTEPVPVIVS